MGSMNRFAILTAVLLVLAGGAAFVSATGFLGGSDDGRAVRLPAAESPTDRAISRLQQRLSGTPGDASSLTELGFAYLQKARESGDTAFYGKADGIFQEALALDPRDPSGLLGASAVAAARHDFEQALGLAQQRLAEDPEDPDAQGALGDALIELGRYGKLNRLQAART